MKNLIVDLDGTLTLANTNDYENVLPNKKLIQSLEEYREAGLSLIHI